MKKSFITLIIATISVFILSGFIFFSGWSVDPSSVYLPNVPFGDSEDVQFTLTNEGPYSGSGTVSITNSNRPTWYSCVSGCSFNLDTDEEHVTTIRFTAPDCPDGEHTNSGATIEFGIHATANIGASVSGTPQC